MESKRNFLFLILSAILLFPFSMATAASQSQATLAVDIRPLAQVEAPSSLVWNQAGNGTSIQIPVSIMIRLNRGAYADLSIERADSLETAQTVSDPRRAGTGPPSQPGLEVEGVGGVVELSASAVLLRRFSQSGRYRHSVILRLSSPPQTVTDMIPLRLKLSSSDGSVAWTGAVSIRSETPVQSEATVSSSSLP